MFNFFAEMDTNSLAAASAKIHGFGVKASDNCVVIPGIRIALRGPQARGRACGAVWVCAGVGRVVLEPDTGRPWRFRIDDRWRALVDGLPQRERGARCGFVY